MPKNKPLQNIIIFSWPISNSLGNNSSEKYGFSVDSNPGTLHVGQYTTITTIPPQSFMLSYLGAIDKSVLITNSIIRFVNDKDFTLSK